MPQKLLSREQVLSIIRGEVAYFRTQKEYAKSIGCSPGVVYRVVHGFQPPHQKMLDAIGVEEVIRYRRTKRR